MGNVIIDFQVIAYSIFFSMAISSILFIIRCYNKYIMYLLSMIIFSVLMGLCYDVHDYDIYLNMYNGAYYFNFNYIMDRDASNWYGFAFDYGFAIVNKIGQVFNLTYEEFRFVYQTILISVLLGTIIKFLKSATLFIVVLSLYIIFPFWDDVFQIRNFFAEISFVVAIYMYIKCKRFRTLIYTAIMLIATTFHSIAWVYVFWAILEKIRNKFFIKQIYKLLITFGILLPVYAMYMGSVLSPLVVYFLSQFTGLPESLTGHYMSYLGETMRLGWCIPYIYVVTSLYLIWKYLPKIKERANGNDYFVIKYLKILLSIMCFMCIFLIIQPFSSNLMRIPRNTLILNYIGLALSMPWLKTNEKVIGYLIAFSCAIIMGLSDFYIKTNDSSAGFYYVLENNFFIDILLEWLGGI